MKLISLIALVIRTTLIFLYFLIFFVGGEKEVKTRLRPDNAYTKTSIYILYIMSTENFPLLDLLSFMCVCSLCGSHNYSYI